MAMALRHEPGQHGGNRARTEAQHSLQTSPIGQHIIQERTLADVLPSQRVNQRDDLEALCSQTVLRGPHAQKFGLQPDKDVPRNGQCAVPAPQTQIHRRVFLHQLCGTRARRFAAKLPLAAAPALPPARARAWRCKPPDIRIPKPRPAHADRRTRRARPEPRWRKKAAAPAFAARRAVPLSRRSELRVVSTTWLCACDPKRMPARAISAAIVQSRNSPVPTREVIHEERARHAKFRHQAESNLVMRGVTIVEGERD